MSTAIEHGRLHEDYAKGVSEEFRVDKEAGIIYGVALLQETSKNGRTYTAKARASARSVYEGRPVHINHGNYEDYGTRNGVTRNIRENKAGVTIGDHHLNLSKPSTAGILEDAEKFPESLAYSHEIPEGGYEAEIDESGHLHVNDLYECDCFAIVTEGGVNKSIKENLSKKEPKVAATEFKPIHTKAVLQEAYPRLTKELEECACEKAEQANKEVVTERDQLKARVAELEAQIDEQKQVAESAAKVAKVAAMATEAKVEIEESVIESLSKMDGSAAKKIIESMKPSETSTFSQRGEKGGLGESTSSQTEWNDADRGIFESVNF